MFADKLDTRELFKDLLAQQGGSNRRIYKHLTLRLIRLIDRLSEPFGFFKLPVTVSAPETASISYASDRSATIRLRLGPARAA
jgi:hypothetical protein